MWTKCNNALWFRCNSLNWQQRMWFNNMAGVQSMCTKIVLEGWVFKDKWYLHTNSNEEVYIQTCLREMLPQNVLVSSSLEYTIALKYCHNEMNASHPHLKKTIDNQIDKTLLIVKRTVCSNNGSVWFSVNLSRKTQPAGDSRYYALWETCHCLDWSWEL